MPHDWLIKTLEGLAHYAQAHGLVQLAAQLEEARDLALVEIASTQRDADEH